MPAWTTDDIPRLEGRVAVVTGANSGLGYETATALAAHGAEVILACRDAARGEDALRQLRERAPDSVATVAPLDLADLRSVRSFAAVFASERAGLDILVNNAGVMAIPRQVTVDGFEKQLGTNHLGHFALTGLLIDRLLARPGARVVTVSSIVAHIGRISWDDLHGGRRYNRWRAYAQSKLANQMFALELDRRARAAGADLLSVAAHPGYAATNLTTSSGTIPSHVSRMGDVLLAQSAAAGALPSLFAATNPSVDGGQYIGPGGWFGTRGHPKVVSLVPAARNAEAAGRLWERSEELTGVPFILPV